MTTDQRIEHSWLEQVEQPMEPAVPPQPASFHTELESRQIVQSDTAHVEFTSQEHSLVITPHQPILDQLLPTKQYADLIPTPEDDTEPALVQDIDAWAAEIEKSQAIAEQVLRAFISECATALSGLASNRRELLTLPTVRQALIKTMQASVVPHEEARAHLIEELLPQRVALVESLTVAQRRLDLLLEQRRISDISIEEDLASEDENTRLQAMEDRLDNTLQRRISERSMPVAQLTEELAALDEIQIGLTATEMANGDTNQLDRLQEYLEQGARLSELVDSEAPALVAQAKILRDIARALPKFVNEHPERKKAEQA